MPAPKRAPSPHDPQPKMRKLDEDGDDLPSKTAPSTINRSLKTERDNSAAPRTKIKPSAPPPPADSVSEPPPKKAKLLNATSASCGGESPSQRTSLKRTASTESDEDDLSSSDGSKAELFRERDDGDKARCVRKYSNRVKAKRDETPCDPTTTTTQGTGDPVQMDHNYGRFSDSCTGDEDETESKETSDSRAETSSDQRKRQEIVDKDIIATCRQILDSVAAAEETKKINAALQRQKDAAPEETRCSRTGEATQSCEGGATKESSKTETKEEVSEEVQRDLKCTSKDSDTATASPSITSEDNKNIYFAVECREDPASEETRCSSTGEATPIRENETKQEVSEEAQLDLKCTTKEQEVISEENQKSEETRCSSTGEATPSCEVGAAKEGSATETKEEVSEEAQLYIKCTTKEQEVMDSVITSEENESQKDPASEETRCSSTGDATPSCGGETKEEEEASEEAQLDVKCTKKEQEVMDSVATASPRGTSEENEKINFGVRLQKDQTQCSRTGEATPSCGGETKEEEEEVLEGAGVSAAPEEVLMGEETVTAEIQTDLSVKIQVTFKEEAKSENRETIDKLGRESEERRGGGGGGGARPHREETPTTPKVPERITVSEDLENHKNEDTTERPAPGQQDAMEVNIKCASAEQEVVETQSPKIQDVSERPTDITTKHEEYHVLETTQNEDFECSSSGPETAAASLIPNAVTTVETQTLERPGDSERITDVTDAEAQKLNDQNEGDDAGCGSQRKAMTTMMTTEEINNITTTVETQKQEVSERTTDVSDTKTQKLNDQNKGDDPGCERQTTMTTTEEIITMTTTVETQNQEVSECTTGVSDTEAQKLNDQNEGDDAGCEKQREATTTVTTEEIVNMTTTVETQNQEVSERTTDKVENMENLDSVTPDVSNPTTSADMEMTSEEMSDAVPANEVNMVSEVDIPHTVETQEVTEPEENQDSVNASQSETETRTLAASHPETSVESEMTSSSTPPTVETHSQNGVNTTTSAVTSNQVETQIHQTQEVPERSADVSEKSRETPTIRTLESNGNKVYTERFDTTESQKEDKETSDPTTMGETQSREVSERTVDADVLKDVMVSGSEENTEEVVTPCTQALQDHAEMDAQTTETPREVTDAPPAAETQSQGSEEVSERTTDVQSSICEREDEVNVVTASTHAFPLMEVDAQTTETPREVTDAPPAIETLSQGHQEVSERTTEIQSLNCEHQERGDEVNVVTRSRHTPEDHIEKDAQTTTTPEEVTDPPPAAETQSQGSQEVSERITDVQSSNWEREEHEDEVNAEPVEVSDTQTNMETSITTKEVSDPPPAAEKLSQGSQEVSERTTDVTASCEPGDEVNAEIVQASDAQTSMETCSTMEEVSDPPSAIKTQSQGSQEVPECTTEVQSSTSEPEERKDEVNTELQEASDSQTNMETSITTEEVSDPSPAVETPSQGSQEVPERTTDMTASCEREDKVNVKRVEVSDSQTNVETSRTPEEVSDPLPAVETQSHGSQEVPECTTEVQSSTCEPEEHKDEVNAECVEASGAKMNMETSRTPEEVSDRPPAVETQSQEVSERTTDMTASCEREDEVNAERVQVSDAETNMETSRTENTVSSNEALSESRDNEMQMESAAEDIQGNMDVISGSIRRVDPVLDEETAGRVINEVKEEPPIISSNRADSDAAAVSDIEGHGEAATGSHEAVAFVSGQPNNVAFQAPDEPMKSQPVHENQIVYEPISSPESGGDDDDGDREISTSSGNHNSVSLLDLQMVGDSSTVQQQICVSGSQEMEVQTAAVPDSCVPEQSNTSVDVKQVAVISSSDDISTLEAKEEPGSSESNGYPDCATESPVQVQQEAGLQEVADVTVSTTTPSAATKVEIPDSTSEEFVILEPVPESSVHFDIVTQAAAESGLSESLAANPEGDMEDERIVNGSQEEVHAEAEEQQKMDVTNSSEVLVTPMEEGVDGVKNSEHIQQPSADMMDGDTPETEMANSQIANAGGGVVLMENATANLDLQEVQILEDIEIGREIVVAEEGNDEDSDITIVEKPLETPEVVPAKKPEETVNEKPKDDKPKENSTAEKTADENKVPEKPKKQEMNTQARTKARLAALAEQKAAASKRTANRQQLNLLALCQEIAEDIATDSMLLKRIEEEKQAAAVAAAALAATAAAKTEATKTESPPAKEEDPAVVATPAGPEGGSSVTPVEEASTAQQSTEDPVEAKPAAETKPAAAEPPKRRFFVSQISVPLKAHEKKKLTRYQRLRQVELQREKMSWARVKKLKSDQANQMFSDMDWQIPLSVSSSFLNPVPTTTPPTPTSPPKTPLPSPASTSKPATPQPEAPKVDSPKPEPSKSEPAKTETPKPEPDKAETPQTETPPPAAGTRRSTRQMKAQTTKESPAPGPAPKVTRSAAKRSLPAAPPPMPNGVTPPKPKPVEYKPYRPRPKYSFDDFELDDDPVPVRPGPQQRPTQTTRPNVQNPAAQSRPSVQSRPTVASQMANQARLKAQTTPGGQTSGQSKPTMATPAQSKTGMVTTAQTKSTLGSQVQSKTTMVTTAQSKTTLGSQAQSKTTMVTTAQSKTTMGSTAQTKPTVGSQVQSKTTMGSTAQSKPAVATNPTSKAAASTKTVPLVKAQLKSAAPTPKASAPGPGQSKPAAPPAAPAAPPQIKPATAGGSAAQLKKATTAGSTTTETKPVAPKTEDGPAAQKTPNPTSSEDDKSKAPDDHSSAAPCENSNKVKKEDAPKCEEKPEGAGVNSSPDNKTGATETAKKTPEVPQEASEPQDSRTPLSDAVLQKEVKKLKESDKDGTQTIIDAGQKHFGAVACNVCGMLYSAANPEDESQHLLFHNQFISAVKYVGWKKERILSEYPDGKIILVLPDDPKYALKKVEEIREMVDNDLGFQQVETKCPSQTKTFLFISNDKKVGGCLIAEHIQEGYRVIEDPVPDGSEGEKLMFERQRAWCCSTTPEPAICGISRIWVVNTMRRRGIASRMLECLRNNFIYGSYLSKDEIAFSDPTPDGKLFATHYFSTSQFLVYNFVSGNRPPKPKPNAADSV